VLERVLPGGAGELRAHLCPARARRRPQLAAEDVAREAAAGLFPSARGRLVQQAAHALGEDRLRSLVDGERWPEEVHAVFASVAEIAVAAPDRPRALGKRAEADGAGEERGAAGREGAKQHRAGTPGSRAAGGTTR